MDDIALDDDAFDATESHRLAAGADQAEGERNVHQPLAALGGRWRHRLLDVQGKLLQSLIVSRTDCQVGCACLVVPEGELPKVAAGRVLEDLDELLDRR